MARSRGGRSGGRRADLRWTYGSSHYSGTTSSAFLTLISGSNFSQTLMRSRGQLLCSIDGPAVNDTIDVGIGFLLAQAGLTGIASTPLTDGDAPFFWFHAFTLHSQTSTQSEVLGTQVYRTEIDSKAMRVVRPDQAVYSVIEVLQVVGTPAVDLDLTCRFLLAD